MTCLAPVCPSCMILSEGWMGFVADRRELFNVTTAKQLRLAPFPACILAYLISTWRAVMFTETVSSDHQL